jgi:hypothetical protein
LPLTVALEAQIDSLRDQVIDVVAIRARLESRMKARLDGEDWNGLEEAVKEFSKLPPRDEFAQKLIKLKEEATKQQEETKKAILTRTAQAQISDLQSLMDRYLDDDAFKAYADAVEQTKTPAAAKKKGAMAKTGKPTAGATPAKAGLAPSPPGSPNGLSPAADAPPQAAKPAPPPRAAPPKSNIPF